MKIITKEKSVSKLFQKEIHRLLLNVYGNQIVNMKIVKRWVMHFNKSDSKACVRVALVRWCSFLPAGNAGFCS